MSEFTDTDTDEFKPAEHRVSWCDVTCAWLLAAGVVLLVLLALPY